MEQCSVQRIKPTSVFPNVSLACCSKIIYFSTVSFYLTTFSLCQHQVWLVKRLKWGPTLDSPQQGCRSGSRRPSRAEEWTAQSWRARGCCPTAPAGSLSPAGIHPSTQPVSICTGETNKAADMSQKHDLQRETGTQQQEGTLPFLDYY